MATNAQTPIHELEAVNTMLSVVGQAPVTSLDNPPLGVQVAIRTLSEVSRAVQLEGWSFNTSTGQSYTRSDFTRRILIGDNVYALSAVFPGRQNLTVRGLEIGEEPEQLYVYDVANSTFEVDFPSVENVTIVYAVLFNDMPPAFRYYCTIRASRTYQKRVLGENSLDRFTAEDEFRALVTLRHAEDESEPHNIFDSPDVGRILPRYWNR